MRLLRKRVTSAPPDVFHFNSFEQHRQFSRGHLDADVVFSSPEHRHAERTLFQTFAPDRVAVAVPVDRLHAVSPLVDENEEMARQGIGVSIETSSTDSRLHAEKILQRYACRPVVVSINDRLPKIPL